MNVPAYKNCPLCNSSLSLTPASTYTCMGCLNFDCYIDTKPAYNYIVILYKDLSIALTIEGTGFWDIRKIHKNYRQLLGQLNQGMNASEMFDLSDFKAIEDTVRTIMLYT